MTKPNNGGPAFPTHIDASYGMTLRDYFAGQALAGLVAKWSIDIMEDMSDNGVVDEWGKQLSYCAYDIADAMLRAREE